MAFQGLALFCVLILSFDYVLFNNKDLIFSMVPGTQ